VRSLVRIEFKEQYYIRELPVICDITLCVGGLNLLTGPNGTGKSSFIQFLKLNSDEYFKKSKLSYVDQMPLKPLNKISYNEIEKSLVHERYSGMEVYQEIRSYITDYDFLPINDLSGGQNQMTKILLSAFIGGDIFVFDEPLQYLDKTNSQLFLKYLEKLKSLGKTILIIEHQFDRLERLVDHRLLIELDANEVRIRNGN
jgi:ABC-type Mn2+/Zn2+ transport system ATPase subunit